MNLRSEVTFRENNPETNQYPELNKSISTDVLVIGAGISGSLIAYELSEKNIPCVILDKGEIACGSTIASTSLLQYELDMPLYKLTEMKGWKVALQVYSLSVGAIAKIKQIAIDIGFNELMDCDSLYFSRINTSSKVDLMREFKARRRAGIEVEILSSGEMKQQYGLTGANGLLSLNAAKTNAFQLTHQLLENIINRGSQVFRNTQVLAIENCSDGMIAHCSYGRTIRAKKIVCASGYEAALSLGCDRVSLSSTYACASKTYNSLSSAFANTLFWSTDDPYFYMREEKSRLIIGGRDEKLYNPWYRDKLIKEKQNLLVSDFNEYFREEPFEIDYAWAGTFANTPDSMPYIGKNRNGKYYYAFAYGGNGITFSVIAAEMIAESIKNGNQISEVFSINR